MGDGKGGGRGGGKHTVWMKYRCLKRHFGGEVGVFGREFEMGAEEASCESGLEC